MTAKKLITNFLGYTQSPSITVKRQTYTEDIVIVMDGSGSIGFCEFKKGKEALKHMMKTANNPLYETKYAAVTFSSTATVNFKFLPHSTAASEITKITYPGGNTNTQAGLVEAKKLFEDPSSGTLPIICLLLLFSQVFSQEDKIDNAFNLGFGSENKFCNCQAVTITIKWIEK